MVGGVTLAFLILAGAMAWAWNQSQSTLHAQGLVESLQTAETSEVPRIVSRIEGYRKWANAPLRQAFLAAEEGSQSQLNCALALLPVDAKMIPYLSEQLLTVGSDQFPVVRKGLSPHHDQVIDRLWEEAVKMRPKAQKSFQAACALATYDPDNPRWSEISPAVANHLVTLRPADVVAFRSELFPVRKPLMEPLAAIFRDPEAREQARLYAAETLAEYASEAPEFLFGLMADADEYYFPLIYDALGEHSERLLALGKGELERAVPENANEDELDALARRKANVAVAFLKQNAEDHVWSLLQHRSDPRSRTDLIHRMSRLDVAPQLVLQRFQTETEDSIRRALLLTLGEFSESQLPAEERQLLIPRLLEVCESDPDPGIHAAAEWLLRRWGGQPQIATLKEKLRLNEQQLRSRSATDDRRWYVNSQGQTFVILEAGEFLMGSPLSDPERDESEVPHRVKIGRSVAISSTEVTMEEYERFLQANPNVERINVDRFSQTGDSPRVGIDWYDATRYCNWLSESECLPEDQWCYEPNDEGKFAVGMQPKTDYLQRTGYRLPTEAEWEFACRANSHVSRYFGGCANLLTNYGWYVMNSPGTRSHPVALLKPNDFGLFDTLGNAQEWCDDIHLPYTTNETDDGHSKKVEATDNRVLRGGAFGSQVSGLRCACRDNVRPAVRYYNTGVRPCRTFR